MSLLLHSVHDTKLLVLLSLTFSQVEGAAAVKIFCLTGKPETLVPHLDGILKKLLVLMQVCRYRGYHACYKSRLLLTCLKNSGCLSNSLILFEMQNDNKIVQEAALKALGGIANLYKVLPTCIYF